MGLCPAQHFNKISPGSSGDVETDENDRPPQEVYALFQPLPKNTPIARHNGGYCSMLPTGETGGFKKKERKRTFMNTRMADKKSEAQMHLFSRPSGGSDAVA